MNNTWNDRLPRIIAPFWCEKRKNRLRLLFEEYGKGDEVWNSSNSVFGWRFRCCSRRRFLSSLLSVELRKRLGQMKRILHSNLLPEQARLSFLARSGFRASSSKKRFCFSYVRNPSWHQDCFGHYGWSRLNIFWPLCLFASLLTSTSPAFRKNAVI